MFDATRTVLLPHDYVNLWLTGRAVMEVRLGCMGAHPRIRHTVSSLAYLLDVHAPALLYSLPFRKHNPNDPASCSSQTTLRCHPRLSPNARHLPCRVPLCPTAATSGAAPCPASSHLPFSISHNRLSFSSCAARSPLPQCGDASGTGVLDLATRQWDVAAMDRVDPRLRGMFPPLLGPDQVRLMHKEHKHTHACVPRQQ